MADKPRVILHGGVMGKFIQLYVNLDEEIPMFVSREDTTTACYHSLILEDILRRLNVPFEFESDNSERVSPKARGKDYHLVGAGEIRISSPDKEIVIFKDRYSTDYNLNFNEEHFEKIKDYFPKRWEVKII